MASDEKKVEAIQERSPKSPTGNQTAVIVKEAQEAYQRYKEQQEPKR